eukprot:gene6629-biopygen5401
MQHHRWKHDKKSESGIRNCEKLTEKLKAARTNVIESKSGTLLSTTEEVTSRWKEYCEELYNCKADKDESILKELKEQASPIETAPPILLSEIEHAVRSLKNNKTPGIDNVPGELLKYGGQEAIKVLHSLCNKVLETGTWPKDWTQSIIVPIPKKISKKCSDYRTISLISHPSKVLLKNSMIVYNNFIDYKKAFDRVWHEALWAVLQKYGIDSNIMTCLKNLYANAKSAVRVNTNLSEFFKCSVGVRQGCILSPMLFNAFLEELVTRVTDGFESGISIQGKPLTNLRFADDIALLAASASRLKGLTKSLIETSKKMGMEISAEKSNVLVVGATSERIDENVEVGGAPLEQVQQFKYLGCTIHENGKSTAEVRIRTGMAKAEMTKLSTIWNSRKITFPVKLRLLTSVITSVLLYGCEAWT